MIGSSAAVLAAAEEVQVRREALLVAAAVLFSGAAAADPAKAQLTLTVTDIKEHAGALMIAVYDQAGYDADKVVAASTLPVTAAKAIGMPKPKQMPR